MARVYNFSAGPAVLPEEVLREAADEMLDYEGCGMSVMEMSHRSKVYDKIIKEAEADLRELMNIPDNYKVLFLQGGASLLFASVPMNLMKNRKAGYILTGQWAKKAYQEAKIFGEGMYSTKRVSSRAIGSTSENQVFTAVSVRWLRNISRIFSHTPMAGFIDLLSFGPKCPFFRSYSIE